MLVTNQVTHFISVGVVVVVVSNDSEESCDFIV